MVLSATPAHHSEAVRTALWVTPVADIAGVARHILDVTAAGIPGWRIVLACPPGPLAEIAHDRGAPVLTGPLDPASGPFASIRHLRHIVTRLRPEIVHTHLAYADLIAAATDCSIDRPRRPVLVSTEHGIAADDALYHSGAAKARAMAWAHHVRQRRLGGIIAVSGSTEHLVRTKWRPPAQVPLEVIPNGIDPPKVAPTPTAGLRIGSISRLAPEKNLDTLIRAFAVVAAAHPQATLTIAGEGPERDRLGRLATELGIGATVTFPGHLDVADALARFDVVAQLSAWENTSYSLLDALAASCGVVATDVGGNPEMLPAGVLVNVGDIDATATAIIDQGLHLDRRPELPEDWPTVEAMCARISAFYDRITRRSN